MCILTSATIHADPGLVADTKRFNGTKISVCVASHTNALQCLKGEILILWAGGRRHDLDLQV